MDKARYLIVGNSVAAVNCVEAIRSIDKTNGITIVSDEEIYNYSRPLLSYYLGGRITQEKLSFVDEGFYEKHGVNLMLGKKATGLDVSKREVVLDDNTTIRYDKCLLSVGGVPIIPPIKGFKEGLDGVFTFLQLKEAQSLIQYIEKEGIKEAVVLGGGLIGLKAVEGLVERGVKTTVIEIMPRILANTFDKDASSIIEERLAKEGCKVIKEDTIYSIETTEKGKIAGPDRT